MEDIESLRKRKEELLLRKQIDRLEARERRAAKASQYSWWWAIPLAAAGVFLFAGGKSTLSGGGLIGVLGGLGMLYPDGAKLLAK